ncbi:MAG: HAD-IIA family hydrolase [Ruminococcaceae bacterium]|nr:HAD-IIA family hydrolase [Oscillospiraceae bacterium]
MNVKDKKVFLLDMDGTLYLGNQLIDGTLDFLRHLKETGRRAVYFTNNSSKGAEKYVEKLAKLGIEAREEDFVTSVNATEVYLKEKNYRKIYVMGTKSLLNQLKEAGLPVTDQLENTIDCLCIGFDTELTFSKLEDASILLTRDIDYVATNPDMTCPTEYGYVPDCGSFAQALYNASKRMPKIIGKPEPLMAQLAIERTGCLPEEMVVIGDRLFSDIACGSNGGIDTIFVLSGECTLEDIPKYGVTPTWIYDSIKEVYQELIK